MTSQAACRLGISIYIVQPEASAVVLLLKALGLLGCPSFTITAVRILFFGRLFWRARRAFRSEGTLFEKSGCGGARTYLYIHR